MKKLINKILKEGDFDWTKDDGSGVLVEVPINEISEWVDDTRYKIAPFIQKIDAFYKQAPKVDWDNEEQLNEDDRIIALTVRDIGYELRNIYSSLKSIDDEIEYLKDPSLDDLMTPLGRWMDS